MNDLAHLRRLEASVTEGPRADAEVVDIGPFRAWLRPTTDLIWLNYVMPIAPLDDEREVADSLGALRQVFADHRRTFRFEFTEELWPTLALILTRAGLSLQASQPLMLCPPAAYRPFAAPNVAVRLLTADDDRSELVTYLSIQSQGFGDGPEVVSDADVARLLSGIRDGRTQAALARLDGVPAGTGAINGYQGVGELVGVATLPALRHHGVATTLSAFLVQDYFERGNDLAWLSAADTYAQAVYERIGFRLLGTLLNYIDEPPTPGPLGITEK